MCHIHPQYNASQNSSSTTNLSDKTLIPGQDRISISNDELFDRPSTSAGILDLSSGVQDTETSSTSSKIPAAHLSNSPTEACVKPCCAVEQSDEKFHPNICNGSKLAATTAGTSEHIPPVLASETGNSGNSKVKGAIQTV